MATSIAQGGSGFRYFFRGVYDYLSGKEPGSLTVDSSAVPDYQARKFIE